MSNIIVPKFPKNVTRKAWDQFYRHTQDQQQVDKVRMNSYLELVKGHSKEQGYNKKAIDGVGECYAEMDSRTYHRQMQNDPDFWKDPSNHKRFFKDNRQYLNEGHKI